MNFFNKYKLWLNFLCIANAFYSPIFGFNINLPNYSNNTIFQENDNTYKEQALSDIQKISNAQLLKYETIIKENIFSSKEEKTNFYLIVAFEIDRRTKKLDKSYKQNEAFYGKTIKNLESMLNLPIHYINTIDTSYETRKIRQQLHNLKFDQFKTTYIGSKKKAYSHSFIYRKKNLLYDNYLKKIKKYISILEELRDCTNSNQFSNLLNEYSKAKKDLNL